MNALEHVLEPITIKNMELRNRVVMPAMGTNLANDDNSVSEANLAYIRRRCQSGAGLYITEIVAVHPDGCASPNSLAVFDDRFIPGLKKMVDSVHKEGGKIAMQLHHVGREGFFQLKSGRAIAPSDVPSLIYGIKPREMTTADIAEVIQAFGDAALRAKDAGFDAVEVHGAHGYLLMQFLSALSNQRQDEYGGTMIKRARFVIEVLNEVRLRVGEAFPISLRISVNEAIKGGYTAEDMQAIVPEFVNAGADIIHASFGTHGSPAGITIPPVEYEPGFNIGLARKMKDVVNVPVIGVGRFTDPALADQAIARGDADLVAFGRQHLADPDFLSNAIKGRREKTIECIACNQGCIERLMFEGGRIRCAINPETGQELKYPIGPVKESLRVWVIGAGPGGLTAAYEAARLGHLVVLFEKEAQLGGQLRFAAKAPYKTAYKHWIDTLAAKVRDSGVEMRMNTYVTKDRLELGNPEYVILASGGEKILCNVEGSRCSMVYDAWQVLNGEVHVGDHVLIVGAGLVGMETADFICSKGSKNVTVVDKLPESPVSSMTSHGYMLHRRLRKAGCTLLFKTEVEQINEGSVTLNIAGRAQNISPLQHVIVAIGLTPKIELKEVLEAKGIQHAVIGDARQARRIIEATEEGARAAWNIVPQTG